MSRCPPRRGAASTLRRGWRGVLVVALLAAASTAVGADAPLGADLDGLLRYARANNPELAAMRHEIDAAQERTASAGALPDPVLRVELQDITNAGTSAPPSLLPSQVGSTKYTLMQPLPFWGKRGLRAEAAAAEADQASARRDATWAETAARLKAAYAQYYLAAHTARITQELIGLVSQLEQIAQARYAGGLAPQQDTIRAQGETVAMRNDLLMVENDEHHARARLNALLGRSYGDALATPQTLRKLPPASRLDQIVLQQRLVDVNPNVSLEAARIRAAEKNRELTYKDRYPDVTVGVAPIQTGRSIGMWEVMFEVNIPLQQNARRAKEREAEAMLDAARARRDAVMKQASADLAENVASLELAQRQQRLATDELLPQAQVSLQAALAAYESGKVDFATVLEAQRQMRTARLNRLKAEVEAQMRLAEIERLVGEDL